MIAKNGDKVVVTKSGDYNGVSYYPGMYGIMVDKGNGSGVGGDVEFYSGKVAYLYKDEYEVVVGEEASKAQSITAESLRNRFLEIEKEEEEISKKIDALSEEKSKIEDDLRVMGFMLCSPSDSGFMPILDDTPEIDYNDWRNWKKGDMVECVNSCGWDGNFVLGGLYKVLGSDQHALYLETEQGETQPITSTVIDFRFHSPF